MQILGGTNESDGVIGLYPDTLTWNRLFMRDADGETLPSLETELYLRDRGPRGDYWRHEGIDSTGKVVVAWRRWTQRPVKPLAFQRGR